MYSASTIAFGLTAIRLAAGRGSCTVDDDCSLNGQCLDGLCDCDAAWTGERCSLLNIVPGDRASGYRHWNVGEPAQNRSSWGGGGWYDEQDGLWYLWVSELAGGCGMATWTTNSQTVRASASEPLGLYAREAVQFPPWTHESVVTRGPAGEYVAFMSYNVPSPRPLCNGCTGGSTNPSCSALGSSHPEIPEISNRDPTYMSWAPAGGARGQWSEPVLVLQDQPQMDTNLAAVINDDGTLVGMWRDHYRVLDVKGKSTIHLVTASDWKDNSTYAWTVTDLLFGDQGLPYPGGVEDPFMWIDSRGNYHAIFHMLYPKHPYSLGGHAFSRDGLSWSWTGQAFDGNVTYTDGTHEEFENGDRPHLLFDRDGRTPIALTTAAGTKWGAPSMDVDQTFTLLRPLATGTDTKGVSV